MANSHLHVSSSLSGLKAPVARPAIAPKRAVATRRRSRQRGVTLIEMMVVVVIIALFVAVVGPRLFSNVDKAKVTAARQQIANFSTALGGYKLDVGVFPSTEQGLKALRVRPEGVANWNGPYLPQEVPTDPWNNAYVYKFPGENGTDEPDIISLGADGQPGGENYNADILSWKSK